MQRRLSIALLGIVLSCGAASCQKAPSSVTATSTGNVMIQFLVTVPQETDPDATIYLAGNLPPLGAWKPNGVPLRKLHDHTWAATLELPRGKTIEYKITRGSWATVEKGPAGEELKNRTLALDGNTIERIRVASWSFWEEREPVSTITGDVRSHQIHSSILGNDRRLWVFVPPGYDKDQSARYPVLYMQDGQNLFDETTSFAGEWHADEIANKLIEQGTVQPILIVGIENTSSRADEYTPTHYDNEGGRGDQYARFVATEVKPFIDRTYRTNPSGDVTGIAGSSLGALISIYMAKNYPDTFGRCGAVSPSLWWDHQKLLHEIEREDRAWASHVRIWIDTGTAESSDKLRSVNQVMDCRALARALERAGRQSGRDFVYFEDVGADHNEASWAKRLTPMLQFLYPADDRGHQR